MRTSIFEQGLAQCPVLEYCRALQSYGYEPSEGHSCFFEWDGGSLKPPAHLQLTDDPADDLARSLAQDAESRVVELAACEGDTEKVLALKDCHKDLFNQRLKLWQAMVWATREGREFTDTELRHYEQRVREAQERLDAEESRADEAIRRRALGAYDSDQMDEHRLLFDEALIADIQRMVGNITNGRPTLVVGDKGIAKTEVAKFVMSLFKLPPKVISVKGDMMSDELIGKMKHDGARNTFVFQEGILLSAMRKGEPVLLDEINFGDQTIIARLQEILLRHAGDQVFIQENDGEAVEVAPGFTVFATANEASARYRHREVLDPAIRDRFDIIIRNYPDMDLDLFAHEPKTLGRLARASAIDGWGRTSAYIDEDVLEVFVRLSYITQYLYSTPAKDATLEFTEDHLKSVVKEDLQPLLTDCITPRLLVNTVSDCARGNLPDRRFDAACIDRLLQSLDQAGSKYNYDLMKQISLMLDIDLAFEGGSAS
ncbi:MAG: AAA family ATPase [Eggerthellaceae bacterium]|nr:AAA family ATPase [Eggerthellaceae bacterium]